MLDHEGIILAIRNKLLTAAADLPDKATLIAWNGMNFTPPDPKILKVETPQLKSVTWLRETYLPGEETQVGYNQLQLVGVMQYDVFQPVGFNPGPALKIAKVIGDTLKPAQGLVGTLSGGTGPSGDPVAVSLTRAFMMQGMTMEQNGNVWYGIPVVICFRSYGEKD